VIYFFFPETARLSLEEIAKNFGEEVAIFVTDATDEEKVQLERNLAGRESASIRSENPPEVQKETPKAGN
jgi:(p)ppGpp synthase/HD superfamily hydrolase